MIQTLAQAKEYMIDRIQKTTGGTVSDTEKELLSTILEDTLFEKIGSVVTDEEIEGLQAKDEKELEGKLFYKVSNYVSLLQNSAAEVLVDYLSQDGE